MLHRTMGERQTMRVFVTGVKGQLGCDVLHELAKRNHDAIGVDIEEMDIINNDEVKQVIQEASPEAVIHCAAWTAVDLAEEAENRRTVHAVNATGTENIAKVCKQLDIKMLYISTDYVFDGQGTRPWEPDDERHPLNVYGQTKCDGEFAVEKWLDKYFIVRIAWVFGVNGNNFVKTMLNLGKTRDHLTVVDDQIGTPTYTSDLARLLVDMIETEKYGRYHATNEGGYISWHEFAAEIFRQAAQLEQVAHEKHAKYAVQSVKPKSSGSKTGLDKSYARVVIDPVSSDAYPTKAKRPSNSRLSKQKLVDNGFVPLPTWQDALHRYLEEIQIGL